MINIAHCAFYWPIFEKGSSNMYYSGLVVTCLTPHFDDIITTLEGMPGVEIHQKDVETCRLVVVIEGETIDSETQTFKAISAIKGVADVSLVVHREDTDPPSN
ncbi:MAG: chaperone NapD [Duodenibacillus sp.]|nr:chaperone NapD [Duodenibacillus sp.]